MASEIKQERLYRVGTAARFLGIHHNTLRKWAREGKVKAVRIGNRGDLRFRLADLKDLLTPAQAIDTQVPPKE